MRVLTITKESEEIAGPTKTEPASRRDASPRFAAGDFMERTFMGGIRLSARTRLFVLIGLICLAAGGFGLYRAQQDLTAAQAQLAQAYELAGLVNTVEASVWRIRAEGILLQRPATAATEPGKEAIQTHITRAIELGLMLDRLYKRPDTADVGEHITTIREAVAQYAETYRAGIDGGEGANLSVEANLREAMFSAGTKLEDQLADINILSLSKTVTDIRQAEAAFVKKGRARDLVTIEDQQQAFARMLSMVPLTDLEITDLEKNMQVYQARLTEYAASRLTRPDRTQRLNEIFAYMAPSIEGLKAFADQRLISNMDRSAKLWNFYLPLIAALGSGLLLVMALAGVSVIRSITGPIKSTAESARRIAGGDLEAVVWGLGNEDETGDIARALSSLKVKLAEIGVLHASLEKVTSEAERGRAATEEAAWLRRDLESQKAELDKGQAAIEEVDLLRKVIEATKSNFLENAAARQQADGPQFDEAEMQQTAARISRELQTSSLDSISEVSQQVAQVSQNVTTAASEAERTGDLIRNLTDTFKRITAIEALLKTIGDQADLLWVDEPDQGPKQGVPGGNLVMLTPDRQNNDGQIPGPPLTPPEKESSVGRRFDIIRATASQATWALRDINEVIRDGRNLALDIAQTSSAEALNITTDLLEQSENLRYMLDSLVHKMRDQLFDDLDNSGANTLAEDRNDPDFP